MVVGVAANPEEARRAAHEILSEAPFNAGRAPRPFRGLLERLVELVVDPVRRVLSGLGDGLPDVGSGPWTALALVVVAVAVIVVVRTAGDRGRERSERRFRTLEASDDPDALERAADQAAAADHFDIALRLRFRAGLLRLDGAGAVELAPGVTNATLARRLRSRRFDGLVLTFDQVAYGGRDATAGDLGEARAGWVEVLAEVGR